MTLKLDLQAAELTAEDVQTLAEMRRRCSRNILLSTTLAASGHPGGSLSALDMLLVTYGCIRHDPNNPDLDERDRVVMSMGHISPGVYSTLAEYGYFTADEFVAGFRRTGSGFPGHVESIVPGVEWDTGNLGQGLSTAVGMAHGFKIQGRANQVITFMGDGEQQKGQVSEASRYAHKYQLDNLIVVVDRNHLQICGSTEDVMPQSVRALYSIHNWDVKYLEDGHDLNAYFQALRDAYQRNDGKPTVIVARTTMGKGISFMENLAKYHGSPLNRDQFGQAMAELGLEVDLAQWDELRSRPVATHTIRQTKAAVPEVAMGSPMVYDAETLTDNRSAYGNALLGLAEANNINGAATV